MRGLPTVPEVERFNTAPLSTDRLVEVVMLPQEYGDAVMLASVYKCDVETLLRRLLAQQAMWHAQDKAAENAALSTAIVIPICHLLKAGVAICGAGAPLDWPKGQQWAYTVKEIEDQGETLCPACALERKP